MRFARGVRRHIRAQEDTRQVACPHAQPGRPHETQIIHCTPTCPWSNAMFWCAQHQKSNGEVTPGPPGSPGSRRAEAPRAEAATALGESRAITAHKCALLSFLLNLLLAALQSPSPINQLVANLICSIRTAARGGCVKLCSPAAGAALAPLHSTPGTPKGGTPTSSRFPRPSPDGSETKLPSVEAPASPISPLACTSGRC